MEFVRNQAPPIAECFVAPQGEGVHTGTLMIFLRLAGCTIGTRYPARRYANSKDTKLDGYTVLPIYTNECHLYDGRTFACDTDYTKKYPVMTNEEVLGLLLKTHPTCKTICLTGGEPLMHSIASGMGMNGLRDEEFLNFILFLKHLDYQIHIETSGTIPISGVSGRILHGPLEFMDWIAVSPKQGFIDTYVDWAGEIKLLVDSNFRLERVPQSIFTAPQKIWLQPVNAEHEVDEKNLQTCLALQQKNPEWRISVQAHKFWKTR